MAGTELAVTVRPAASDDVPVLLELFGGLADYERLRDELQATEEQLRDALFGARPAAEALIAEHDSRSVGYALFFPTFSSFRASRSIWLEDLFVLPDHRGAGVGRALMAAVAARVAPGGRLEWCALDWNELALGFYQGIGAQPMDQWTTLRLDGDALAGIAAEAPRGT
ncbi:MAG TPA: GNAT family N-acetyltransferase [Solirubrobacteraceae bacterium]|nr:GNAT family N-acetyltransferase [Solirubrobacteraceae bacterium]